MTSDYGEHIQEQKTDRGEPDSDQPEGFRYWRPGKILPGNYHVVRRIGRGGMGTVYLVERKLSTRPLQFAVKTLSPEIAGDPKRRRTFLRELRTWIDLPDFPHIVACRFFRTIDNMLAVFAEYIDGGALDQWIRAQDGVAVEKILDIAIQITWGLHFAHECGVIHQDVKSPNILITRTGEAKITDFGLARSRYSGRPIQHERNSEQAENALETLAISSGGMTRAYCSIEQAHGKKITRRTDIWSFGLTLLEMFNGGLDWPDGSQAPRLLQCYLERGPIRPMPPMPGKIAEILHKCFMENPLERWENMMVLANSLVNTYEEITGRTYPRHLPSFEMPTSDHPQKSQRRTSDGGRWVDPADELRKVLEIAGSSGDLADEILEKAARSQQARTLQDIEIFEHIENLYIHLIQDGQSTLRLSLADIIFNQAQAIESCHDYLHAGEQYSRILDLLKNTDTRNEKELAARSSLNLAACRYYTGQCLEALTFIDMAIHIFTDLLTEKFDVEIAAALANSHMNQGVVLKEHKRFADALPSLEKAMEVGEDLIRQLSSDYNWNILGFIYSNLSTTFMELNQMEKAMDMLHQAVDIFQVQLDKHNTYEAAYCLGMQFINRAIITRHLRQYPRAIEHLDRALEFIEHQITCEKRGDMRIPKAETLFQRAQIRFITQSIPNALRDICDAEDLLDIIVNREGQIMYLTRLARVSLCSAAMHLSCSAIETGAVKSKQAVRIWTEILDAESTTDPEQSLKESYQIILEELAFLKQDTLKDSFLAAVERIVKQLPLVVG